MSIFRSGFIRGQNKIIVKNLILPSFKKLIKAGQNIAESQRHRLLFRNVFGFSREIKFTTHEIMKFPSKSRSLTIRELNIQQKDNKNEEKDKNKKTKPVVKTKVTGYKNEWGVKLPEDSVKPMIIEKNLPNFELERKWGVNFLKSNYTRDIQNQNIKVPRFQTEKSSTIASLLDEQFINSYKKDEIYVAKSDNPPPIIDSMNISSVVFPSGEIGEEEKDEEDENPFKNLNKEPINITPKKLEIEASASAALLTSGNSISLNIDYYVTRDLFRDDEILAWQDVVKRTIIHKEEIIEAQKNKIIEDNKPEIFSIPPEPPSQIADLAVVKSLGSRIQQDVDSKYVMKKNGIPHIVDAQKFIYHVHAKKFHTLSSWFLCTTIQDNNLDQNKQQNTLPVQIFDITKDPIINKFTNNNYPIQLQIAESINPIPGVINDVMRLDSEKKPSEDEKINDENKKNDDNDDFVHAPGDPYPFNRENYEKWRLPHGSDPLNRQPSD